MRKNAFFALGIIMAITLLAAGCGTLQLGQGNATKAVAVIRPLNDSGVQGLVTFIQEGGDVRIVAEITGLTPGKHGFHIHQFGDITSADGNTAGSHFNPQNFIHGGPDDKKRHLGDLGNIEADRNGKAKYNRVDSRITLNGVNSILGRSIIIKEGPDDYKTQPGGGAGRRIAMGVIGQSATPIE